MHDYIPGMVLNIRNRLWRIDNIYKNELTATSIDGAEVFQRHFYIPFENIKVSSMNVPGTESIGRYSDNILMVDANRLNLIHSTAPLLALQRSRAVPTSYQLVPLIMSLRMPRVRLLIADDVGLGKTIEAGLIATELISRQKIRNMLVICPANLRDQWQEALSYFFHIDTKIISTRQRKNLEKLMPAGANPWTYYRYLISSIDYVKRPEIKNELLQYPWNLVIIDEAHLVAKPHQTSPKQASKMDRYIFAKDISKIASNLILVTATPHNGYSDSYASLLQMLDGNIVSSKSSEMRVIPEKAKNYVCQRRRKDVEKWFSSNSEIKSPFPKRKLDEEIIDLKIDGIESKVLQEIENYGNYLLDLYRETNMKVLSYWNVMHFHKRALSSPEALRKSLKNRLFALNCKFKEDFVSQVEDNNYSEEIAKDYIFDNDISETLTEEEAACAIEQHICGSRDQLECEKMKIEELLDMAEQITPSKDSKLKHLLNKILPELFRNDSHVIIFTKYKNTLDYLEAQLTKTYKDMNIKIFTIYGEMNEEKRLDEYKRFSKAGKAVLIATDCISEGINLQQACCQIIHYELPWNPNRLEQRNGRVDRYGQPKDTVYIKTIVVNDSLDTKILSVLMKKAEQIRQDYGFSPPYFSNTDIILSILKSNGIDLRKKSEQISFSDLLNTEKEAVPDPFNKEALENIKQESFYGQSDININDVQKLIDETYKTVGTKNDLMDFCLRCLNKFNCEIKQKDKDNEVFNVKIMDDDLKIHGMKDNITFNPERGLQDLELEVIDLAHPFVNRFIEKVKYTMYVKTESSGRIAGVYTNSVDNVTAIVTVLVRYMVETDPPSVMEDIAPVVIDVYNNKMLDDKYIEQIESPKISGNVDKETIKEAIDELYNRCELNDFINKAIDNNMNYLMQKRKRMKSNFNSGINQVRYLDGFENITVASKDILTITLFYPD